MLSILVATKNMTARVAAHVLRCFYNRFSECAASVEDTVRVERYQSAQDDSVGVAVLKLCNFCKAVAAVGVAQRETLLPHQLGGCDVLISQFARISASFAELPNVCEITCCSPFSQDALLQMAGALQERTASTKTPHTANPCRSEFLPTEMPRLFFLSESQPSRIVQKHIPLRHGALGGSRCHTCNTNCTRSSKIASSSSCHHKNGCTQQALSD